MMLQTSFTNTDLNPPEDPIELNASLRLELVSLFNRCRRKGLFHCFLALLGRKSQRLRDFKAFIRGNSNFSFIAYTKQFVLEQRC